MLYTIYALLYKLVYDVPSTAKHWNATLIRQIRSRPTWSFERDNELDRVRKILEINVITTILTLGKENLGAGELV